MAVVVCIADAHRRAVRQTDAPRALHLQEEELDRIIDPAISSPLTGAVPFMISVRE
jgi:hypothetical protein